MLECLKQYVDVWDKCSPKESGKLYLNDLPAFTMDMPEYVTNEEMQSGYDVLRKCISNACTDVHSSALNILNSKLKIKSILDNGIVGFADEDRLVRNADSGYHGGMQIEIPKSFYTEIFIKSITVFIPTVQTFNLKIFDLYTGQQLDTFSVTTQANRFIEVEVNKSYASNGSGINLFIGYDSVFTSNKCNVVRKYCGSCGWKKYSMNSYVYARECKIRNGSSFTNNDLTSAQHTFGLTVNYALNCETTNLFCELAPRLKTALFYKSGMNLMDEIIHSNRINVMTTLNKENAKQLKEQVYEPKYLEAMSIVFDNYTPPSDICFSCKDQIHTKEIIP